MPTTRVSGKHIKDALAAKRWSGMIFGVLLVWEYAVDTLFTNNDLHDVRNEAVRCLGDSIRFNC